MIYRSHTDYWGENITLADELWESLDTNPVAVALSDEYARGHGLPESARFPWDDEKGLYFIKAIHDLHCIVRAGQWSGIHGVISLITAQKVLRQAFINFERGLEQTVSSGHVNHCLDGIRQDVMCKADDTPMPITMVRHSVGNNQVMQCRDWNKLVAWSYAPERNACFRLLDDYKEIGHSLERHQFCPEGSEYYPVMKEYFEKHGHQDPFEGASWHMKWQITSLIGWKYFRCDE